MRIIFVTGQAGSGKDTLCHNFKKWADEFNKNVTIIWNGDLVREYSKTDTYFGKLVKMNNEQGKLAPGFIMDMLVGQELISMKDEPDKIIVWNGSPRTKEDEVTLSKLMEYMEITGEIIVLQVNEAECLRRVNRRQEEQNRPELLNKDSIKEKFGWYKTITSVVLRRLSKNIFFKIYRINAKKGENEIFETVLQKLCLK